MVSLLLLRALLEFSCLLWFVFNIFLRIVPDKELKRMGNSLWLGLTSRTQGVVFYDGSMIVRPCYTIFIGRQFTAA